MISYGAIWEGCVSNTHAGKELKVGATSGRVVDIRINDLELLLIVTLNNNKHTETLPPE